LNREKQGGSKTLPAPGKYFRRVFHRPPAEELPSGKVIPITAGYATKLLFLGGIVAFQ
jgi:hypothetical protein